MAYQFTQDDRIAVLTALAEEVGLRHRKEPYSDAVIKACEMVLEANPMPSPIEYWWMRD